MRRPSCPVCCVLDQSDPGMHTTDTIDFEVVLEGTIVLELDDGAEVPLARGYRGAERHSTPVEEPGDTTARLACSSAAPPTSSAR